MNSRLARFGRSKVDRNDAKLVVLALVINLEGFIKYSSIYEGNITDNTTLEKMIDKLGRQTCEVHKPTVVLDAGITTDENLRLIRNRVSLCMCVNGK